MVFNQCEQSFTNHLSEQFGYVPERHLSSDEQRSPLSPEFACKVIHKKSSPADEESKGYSRYHKEVVNSAPDDNSHHGDTHVNPRLSRVTGSHSEVSWLDNGKRSLCDEPCLHASNKRLKEDQNVRCGSYDVHVSASEKPLSASAESKDRRTTGVAENAATQETSSNCIARSNDREASLDTPARLPSYCSYFEVNSPETKFDGIKETNLPVFEYYSRKHVAIGANHQANVPELRFREIKDYNDDQKYFGSPLVSTSSVSYNDPIVIKGYNDKWVGRCVMPMPDSSLLASDAEVSHWKVECRCMDEGSLRCIRQHVTETNDKLRKNLGLGRFVELGFHNMGEVVAQAWTEEEEELFHKVVLRNPASLGMNFWNVLPRAFPSRSSKELVSYYFNVFMLRKRAAQNRLDPMYVDSDSDEWQDSDDGEFAMDYEEEEEEEEEVEVEVEEEEEEEYDNDDADADADADYDEEEISAVESPLGDQYDISGGQDLGEEEITEESDDAEECDHYTSTGSSEKEHAFQDDSCTSFEGHENRAASSEHVDIFDLQGDLIEDRGVDFGKNYKNDGLCGLTDNGLFDGHCDSKAWEMDYNSGAEKDDFLPTCNLIEEVFGKEPCDK